MKHLKFLVSWIAITSLLFSFTPARAIGAIFPSPVNHIEANGDQAIIGTIITSGLPEANGNCHFDAFEVHIQAPANGKIKWLGITFRPICWFLKKK